MAKLHTSKKSNNIHPDVARELHQVTDYIKQWTDKELADLHTNRTPICIPVKGGYKIGLYNLRTFPNKMCEVWNHNNELVHAFKDKVSAVLYTIYTIKNKHWIADDILRLDREINKNYSDVLTMRRFIESARKRNEHEHADIREARLHTAETKLTYAQAKMQDIHRRAKLAKVWE